MKKAKTPNWKLPEKIQRKEVKSLVAVKFHPELLHRINSFVKRHEKVGLNRTEILTHAITEYLNWAEAG